MDYCYLPFEPVLLVTVLLCDSIVLPRYCHVRLTSIHASMWYLDVDWLYWKMTFPKCTAPVCTCIVIFASKRNKAKRNSSLFFRFFRFFSLFFDFSLFFTFFRLIFVSLRFFHLIFAYFTFVFASDFWCFTSKWIMWNQAFFSLPSEAKFSLQFQISLPKRKWGRTLVGTEREPSWKMGARAPLKMGARALLKNGCSSSPLKNGCSSPLEKWVLESS
jgi:hypothetical protein